MLMKKIAIFGAGGFGREVKMLIDQINEVAKQWEFIGFFDDRILKGEVVNGYPVFGGGDELLKYTEQLEVVFAIGNPVIKKKVISKVAGNPLLSFPTLIHPNCQIGKDHVSIGKGTIITAGVIVTVNISIGAHVILNLSTTVGHDTKINDYCSIMPGVNISGEVELGECVYIGTGAKIINQVTIGERSIIGAGAVVSRSIGPDVTAVGIPAKPLAPK
jgi:sugar O-acyltransferase (sialic acid O-acetyltransferase NeuD family)